MSDLVSEYGYASEGESFSIADPNEAWIFEIISKGANNKGAVWVARRIPEVTFPGMPTRQGYRLSIVYRKKNSIALTSKELNRISDPNMNVFMHMMLLNLQEAKTCLKGKMTNSVSLIHIIL